MKTKKLITLLLSFFLITHLSSQNYNCSWIAPLPQGNMLKSAYFFDGATGFVVGKLGTILKTTTGGKSWQNIKSPTTENLLKVFFTSRTNGVIIGRNGSLLLTSNGGTSWTTKKLDTRSKLKDMDFANNKVGFILTERSDLFKTVDGGINWKKIALPSRNQVRAIDFSNPTTGVIIANRYELLHTKDGGTTWTIVDLKASSNTNIQKSYFSDIKMHGNTIVVSSKKNLFFSTDFGKSWTSKIANAKSGHIENITIVNNQLTLLTDAYGNILKSQPDASKEYLFKLEKEQKTKIQDIFMLNTKTGFAVGQSGRVFNTQDGGENWRLMTQGTTTNFKDIEYVNASVGYLLADDGKLFKTLDAGKTLIKVKEIMQGGFTNAFLDLHFIDANKGFVCTSMGNIYATKDAGKTWKKTTIEERKLTRFKFVDSRIGYIGSKGGIIYKTTDAGISWKKIQTGIQTNINDIDFVNAKVGYAAGDKGVALKTVDGGKTWTKIQTILKNSLIVVKAISPTTVMFSTSGNFAKMADASIIRSTDGGASWKEIKIKPYAVYKFDFFNAKIGAAICSDGVIATTTDGGATWHENPSITNSILWGIHWKNANEMLLVGTSGAIVNCKKGTVTSSKIATNNNKVATNKINPKTNNATNKTTTAATNKTTTTNKISETNKTTTATKTPVIKVDNLKRKLNGVEMQFSSIKKVKKQKIGVLKTPVKIKVGANTLSVPAGSNVNYDSAQATILRAQIAQDTKVNVKGGQLFIKGKTYVSVNKDYILNARIKEDTELKLAVGTIPVKAVDTGDKPNVVFTNKGDLTYAVLSKDFSTKLDEMSLTVPADSKLSFSVGQISKVNLVKNQKVKLADKEYEIEGKPNASITSIYAAASTGVISSIRVTGGHSVFANDIDIPVKPSSYIVFTKKTGSYEVRKFDLGKAMIVDIHKKKKIKQKSLKFGKTVVVEDGKIVRTAL